MRPIRTPADLLKLVKLASPTRACHRAIEEDRITFLGGFTPPGDFPQWIVQVQSVHGKKWWIVIKCNAEKRRYTAAWLHEEKEIPWAYWIGRWNGKDQLRDGDNPGRYALRRATANTERQHGK